MTGFGIGRSSCDGSAIEVQLSAVNHRSCQVTLRGDLRDVAAEDALRKEIREALQRGSINVQITIQQDQAQSLDLAPLAELWQRLNRLAQDVGAPTPTVESLLPLLPRRTAAVDENALHGAIHRAAREAIAACVAVRESEGAATAMDLRQRAAVLRRIYDDLVARAPQRLGPWREALRARVQEALGEQIDPDALARECAIQADRIDLSEELTRLQAHLERLDALLVANDDEAVGRPLEFLLQELGREINTTGAKANDAALTALVLDAKNILEQIREQAANVL